MPPNEVKQLEDKMDRILFILDNDQGTGKRGLVAEVDELKIQFYKFVNKYNVDQAKKSGAMAVWAIVGGAIWTGFVWFIQRLFTHI